MVKTAGRLRKVPDDKTGWDIDDLTNSSVDTLIDTKEFREYRVVELDVRDAPLFDGDSEKAGGKNRRLISQSPLCCVSGSECHWDATDASIGPPSSSKDIQGGRICFCSHSLNKVLCTVFIIFMFCMVVFFGMYTWAHFKIEKAILQSGSWPTYQLSDVRNDTILVHAIRNRTYDVPVYFTTDPFNLTYGTEEANFGHIQVPVIEFIPDEPTITDFVDFFYMQDTEALSEFGNDFLNTLLNGESKTFRIVAHGDMVVRSLGILRWRVKYRKIYEFSIGDSDDEESEVEDPDGETERSSFGLIDIDWALRRWGIEVTAHYNNTVPFAMQLGDISAKIEEDGKHLSDAFVDDYELSFYENMAVVEFRVRRFFHMVGLAIGGLDRADIVIKDINVSRDGAPIVWFNDILEGVNLRLPMSSSDEERE